jgi:hypothetical protein
MIISAACLVAGCAGGTPPPANPGQSQCLMGSDGVQACGYKCMMGSDGHTACANSPDGVCAMGADGRVVCSEVAQSAPAGAPPPTCKMGSDGSNTCGYNCQFGANGHWYCASRPDGRCAFNADGTFTCP